MDIRRFIDGCTEDERWQLYAELDREFRGKDEEQAFQYWYADPQVRQEYASEAEAQAAFRELSVTGGH
jgi:hypothetical protein